MTTPRHAETTVGPDGADRRLDVWLARRFTYHSRSQWRKLVGAGRVLVNDGPARTDQSLREGDRVAYVPEPTPEPPVDFGCVVLRETPDYVAVGKPGDLPCHPGGRYFRHTLWQWLSDRYRDVYLVHRLDRETSGVVVAARTAAFAAALGRAFADHLARKEYLVLVEGETPAEWTADGFLADDRTSPVRKKRRFLAHDPGGGEPASTHFVRLGGNGELSLVRCLPRTGRLHQIRATLQSQGFPVVGDKLYGVDDGLFLRFIADTLTADDRARLRLGRQALHAERLCLPLPDGPALDVCAPLPPDMAGLLATAGIALPSPAE